VAIPRDRIVGGEVSRRKGWREVGVGGRIWWVQGHWRLGAGF
jgi:hypothetical protein